MSVQEPASGFPVVCGTTGTSLGCPTFCGSTSDIVVYTQEVLQEGHPIGRACSFAPIQFVRVLNILR